MQKTKSIAGVLLAVGALLLLLSLLADLIGLGPSPGFGLWQVGGSLAGLALAGVEFWLMRKP